MSLPAGLQDPFSPEGRALRFAHEAACSLFMTTLGPRPTPSTPITCTWTYVPWAGVCGTVV